MNCKPGDMAMIVHPAMGGKIVEVLYAAPSGSYTLPDGFPAVGSGPERWVVKSLGSPFMAPTIILGVPSGDRSTMYGACHDKWLRPIRPDDQDLEIRNTEKPVTA